MKKILKRHKDYNLKKRGKKLTVDSRITAKEAKHCLQSSARVPVGKTSSIEKCQKALINEKAIIKR